MDYQDNLARSLRSQCKPTEGGQRGNVGPPGSRQQQGPMTSNDGTGRVNQELRWEKVPVVHSGSSNNTIRVVTSGRFNGPRPDGNPGQDSPTDALFHAMNKPFQDPNFWHTPHHQSQGYFQQSQPAPHNPRVVKVPMLIETTPVPQSPAVSSAPLPVMPAKVSHNFEIVRASLVHPGTPLGPYSSQTFTVDESELDGFDPFKKQESILKSLDLDVTRLRRGLSTPDDIVMKETSFGPENRVGSNDLNNNGNDDDDAEIIIDSAPRSEHFKEQRRQHQQDHQPHRPQHPVSPSKSSAGDLKSGPLFRKPSNRRKSNPLAAFLQGGSKEVKKSSKTKTPSSAVLPAGLKIRERGCSLTRCPTDSKTRLDQLMGNPPNAKNADPLSDAWTDYIESTYEKFETVLRKEQEGYGIQLHGQYPVVVDNVRPGGGAGKGGIMKGDIIFKINGKLVIKQNHEYVIECFRNPFMSITVLRAPQTGEAKQNNLPLFGLGDKISNPSPAARDKNLELEKNTLATLRSMHVQAVGELEQLKTEAQRNSDDLMMMKFEKQAKLVNQLEKRISQMELSSGQLGVISSSAPDAGTVTGGSHAMSLKLPVPLELCFGPSSTGSQTQAPDILSMEGLDNPVEEESEALAQHKEFEDLNLLMKSLPHLACFLKYLIQSSNPSYMLFHIVADCYTKSSPKEPSLSAKWAFEIYLAFLLETSPLPLRLHPNIVKFVESCLSSGKDIKSIFQMALSSVQEQIVKQLEEFQHQRTLGLGNFFGEEFLEKPKSNLSTSLSFTAPVTYNASNRPPLPHSNISLTPSTSMTSVNSSVTSSKGSHLSSSSFSNTKSSSVGGGSDIFAVEKILWDVFESCLAREEENPLKPEEMRPAIAATLATFFRHHCVTLSRQNQSTLEGLPSFVWRDKKALKSKLKVHVGLNGHDFVPHVCSIMTIVECSLCSNVLWGAGYQGHRCQYCDMVFHNSCMRLPSVPHCSKVPSKLRSGRDEQSSTFYASDLGSFHTLPLKRKKKGLDEGPILSDSENAIMSELDLVSSPTGSMTPLISAHGSGPSLSHLSSYEINDSDMEVEQDLPPLAKVIPEDTLSQLVGVARKKQEIINELFYTERSHVKSLLITVHYFLKPMRNDPKIDQQLVDLLFPNLESIVQWHKELSSDFKARRKEQPVVQEIGDILMNRFSGPSGLKLQEQCAEFCKDQLVNLELLKNKRRQDAYLNHFIMNATQKEVCKKQDLKDRLPKVMQRLTKYPLLFDNLLKITPVGTEEHARLLRALKNMKMILDAINETVRDSENRRVLQDMQRRMDARHLENERHPALEEFKNLQLTDHKLCHHGPLTWNVNASKNIELYLALFQDFLVIFQSQDSRLVLKCETMGQDSAKFVFIPILKLGYLLVKNAARTTRKFYLINVSKEASQMYTLTAKTKDVREEWMKQIREATEEWKKKHSQPQSPSKQPPKPSVLTEVNPCYEVVEPEPIEASQRQDEKAANEKEQADVTDGAKEEADDDELTNNEHSSVAYDPEKELKRQIIATHELMMDKVKALSELHHIQSPNFDLSEKTLPLDTDSDTFITAMDGIIEGMTVFFNSLPDVLVPLNEEENGSREWDPVESLLELGERLEMLVRQLENLVFQRNSVPEVPPPVPTSEPPQLDEESAPPDHSLAYVESNF